ncbi:hypothetical protein GCM10009865_07110 [Aeromicrobium ponti]|uniref:Polymer-forming protein n=1 Tax=Cytobacillus oceanisediminis TaxID=665099 RepID=A0A562K713_9BACI|nr:hypothetical protein [Cytobacillus oceanisediminis]TWH91156.1 hypothetical protein IQ19_00610 [Cytobacillus oceanisediminis]
MAEIRNISINGSGSTSGGSYRKMAIRGEGAILDDVECDQLMVFGSSELKGSIKFNKFHVFGETSVKENLHGEGLR